MRTKYYNDGIIGNQKLTVGLTKTGELNRLFWGSADFKQFIDTFHVGIKVNDSALIYLHNDINNTYSQEYIEDTNVLRTNIINNYFNVSIVEEDFVPIDENVLVRSFKIKNNNSMELNINLLAYSKLFTDFNNDTCGYVKEDTLIQYNHDFSVCTFSKEPLYSYQINGAEGSIMSGIIGGKDYIGLSNDSIISLDNHELDLWGQGFFALYFPKYICIIRSRNERLYSTLFKNDGIILGVDGETALFYTACPRR